MENPAVSSYYTYEENTLRYLVMALLLVSAASSCFAGKPGGKVEYVGGTVGELPEGSSGRLVTTSDEHLVFQLRKALYLVPWERINLLEYGQRASRRIVMAAIVSPLFVLSKSRKHYLTIGFTDDEGDQQAAVFRVDKGDVRMLLVSLEAKTNLEVEYQDDEARRAGKGN